MLQYLNMIHFAGVQNKTIALSLCFFVFLCLFVRFIKTQKSINKLTVKKWRNLLILNASFFKLFLKASLFMLGFCFLMIALLRPQWNKKEEQVAQTGRDLLIAVDISRSMLAQDLKPNRLEFAKKKIKKLLYNLSCERVGLILFSGESVLQCPLTTDYGAFFMFLDGLDVEMISSGTTTIDGALLQAMNIFESMPTKKTKLLCLFTDGEDFSTNLVEVKDKAAKEGIAIFTFGIGTTHGAPIPIIDEKGKRKGFEKDDKGAIIMSKLNEGILKNLAQQTGGKYILATKNDSDIKEFIKNVSLFETDSLGERSVERYQEQYPYFIAISFLCFLLEWLL
ncbi:MAG: VWA domain-containing protein [Candidatus Dependentiae bacterium]|nr:VWA domain-containing protein [Candidatus Dependentiae bacterium]